MTLIAEALESANRASPAIRVYAHFVQGMAWRAKGRDSLATAAFSAALARYHDLTAQVSNSRRCSAASRIPCAY